MNSGRVRKTPVKGNGMARRPNANVLGRGMEDDDEDEGGEVFVSGNRNGVKYEDDGDEAFLGGEC